MSFLLNHLPFLDTYLRNLTLIVKDKWEVCTIWMSTFMPQPLAQIYFSKKLPIQKMKEVHTIVEAYKETAKGLIDQQMWLNDNMKRKLKKNLSNLATSHLLWMKYLADGTFDGLMEKYLPTNSSFLWNVLDYQKQQFNFYLLKTIPEPAGNVAKIFQTTAQHTRGLVDLLFGILVPPVYDSLRPRWMNYASLGFVVAHEIGHELIFYFKTNEISDEALQKINSTATCLIGQYSNFTQKENEKKHSSQISMAPNKNVFKWYAQKFHDLFVNGTLTFEENLADLIAIELIEKAVHLLTDEFSPTCVPEFPYSTRQLYYILITQLWCETEMVEMDLEDKHAAARFRMTGIMQNAEEFSEAFQCDDFSFMNPKVKCSFFK
ncbi:membrane metallo-endopeptidase-like 1 isoform X1 [Parasteatoda tepidariorum]|uniref:membrane metallo-endopeptidase-like 1 isoform X1 n=1 Tax=Parasteatoda tepidariorum TaxID=114398 RepID=UPI001C71910D|nr:membrane metallo-endopeptidase-like 1 isoform X1 [Parasteatoda tepidariorum]